MGLHLAGSSVTGLSNAYARLSGVQATRTTDGALVAGSHNPVDATSGNRTVTLADAPSAGLLIAVSKKDSSANTVAVSVAHLRDGGAGTITLVGQYEALTLTSKADGTWWPIGDHKTKAYFDSTYAPKRAIRVVDLVEPWINPHRGAGAFVAPGNTLEAMRVGAQMGLDLVDGGDWSTSADGMIVCSHDLTVDFSTTSSGSVSSFSAAALFNMVVDASSWFGGTFSDTKMPTADQVFGELGGNVVLLPEPKDATAAAPLARMIQRLGLQDSVIPNTFNAAWLTAFQAIGCTNILLNITVMPNQATMDGWKAQGINWIGIDYTGTLTPANIATLKANGFKVMVGTIYRASDAAQWLASGINGWTSDDPLYFAHALDSTKATKYRRTTDPFSMKTYYHGHISDGDFNPTHRGAFIGGNRMSLPSIGYLWVLQGWACPLVSPTTYNIDFTTTFDALGSDTTRWFGCWFASPTDRNYQDNGNAAENGYQFWFRANGQLNLVRKVNGVSGGTQSASSTALSVPITLSSGLASGVAITALPVNAIPTALASGAKLALPTGQIATLSAGATVGATSLTITSLTPTAAVASGTALPQSATFRVAVTSTTITVTRTDVSPNVAVTLTDASNRGAYFYFAHQPSGLGLQTSVSNVAIS